MVLSLIKDTAIKASIKKDKTVKPTNMKPKNVMSNTVAGAKNSSKVFLWGSLFGIGAGVGDGIVTAYANKKNITNALEEYRRYSFSEKRSAIGALHKTGKTIRDYKKCLTKMQNPTAMILNRVALYASILGVTGFVIDMYKNSKQQGK